MIKNNVFKINVLAVLLIGLLTMASYGQESGFKPVADEMIGSSGITWMPRVNYSQLELTISRPNGTVFSKTFNSGSSPYVGLSEIFGDSYLDGSYNYELRVTPVLEQQSRSAEIDRFSAQTKEALVQSGAFFIQGGAIVTNDISEVELGAIAPISSAQDGLSRTQDIVHLDDVIIDGSLCVGIDCVNGESFGFDTIRLKENNLRIKFQDTSSSASFPSNDWQITANDSSNGGANKFSIDDIDGGRTPFTLEAGAPSHSLYVDDGGRVGFGTSTPVVDLHVKSGNTPTLRLEQDGTSGFTPQTWDVAGNETNFFVRDATNGSQLPFRIFPGADSNSLVIDAQNDVGIGTASPEFPLHIKTSGEDSILLMERSSGVKAYITASNTLGFFGTANDFPLRLMTNGSWRAQFNTDNSLTMRNGATCTTGGVWTSVSTREAKENIRSLTADEALESLEGLNPVKFNYKAEKEEGYVGFIAEDVPELVATKDRKRLATMDVVAVLTKVVKEQQKSLKEQQEIISQLKEKVDRLEKNSQ